MNEWKKVKLGDFISLQRGYDLTKEQIIQGPYPVVSSTSIMGYHNTFKVEAPGVIIGRSGTLGEVQYVKTNFWPHNTSLFVKDFKGNEPLFVYYFLKNLGTDSAGGGAAIPTLNRNHLYVLNITKPSLPTQKRIATILYHYDSLIANYQQQINLLEEAAQRLFKEWFVDLRFPSHESIKICDGVPEGWEKTNINSILTFHRGYDLTHKEFVDGPYPVVGSTSIIGNHNKYKIEGPGIVTGRSGSLGIYQLIWDNYWPHNTSLYISDFKGHNVFYIYCLLKTVDFTTLNSGGAIPSLNRNTLSNISVMEPPMSLQANFSEKVMPMFKRQRHLQSQVQLLTEARDRLLPKLMSGEISVETAQSVTSGLGVRKEQTVSPQASD